jgi:hypothetical protein
MMQCIPIKYGLKRMMAQAVQTLCSALKSFSLTPSRNSLAMDGTDLLSLWRERSIL